MRPRAQVLFSLCIVLLAAWALYSTRDWPIKTALYPRVVGVPLLLLAAAEFVLSLRGTPESQGRAVDVEFATFVVPELTARRTVVAVAWMGGFFLAIILLGFPRAIPLFVVAYLRGQGRESWILSVALAAVAWLGFYGLFIRLLHLPFAPGLLWQMLGR